MGKAVAVSLGRVFRLSRCAKNLGGVVPGRVRRLELRRYGGKFAIQLQRLRRICVEARVFKLRGEFLLS